MHGNEAFIYLGTNGTDFPLAVPHPTIGNAGFEAKFNLETETNTNGEIVGQLRGAMRETQQVGWSLIESETWWKLCRWVKAYGPFFYIKYFNHCFGEWMTGSFYTEGFSCDPILAREDGKPGYYTNAVMTLVGTGARP